MSGADDARPDAVLAAEWALGLLDPDERRDAEARRLRDPAFAQACADWAEHAATLLAGEDIAPPAHVWQRIASSLPANDPADGALLRRQMGRWRALALVMTATTIGFGALAIRSGSRPPAPPGTAVASEPPLVVILTSPESPSVASVSIDRTSGRIAVASKALDMQSRSAELWVIPADKVPRSLGLLPVRQAGRFITPPAAAPRIARGMTLAVSLEPLGGSPTGKPTGPIIVTGTT